MVAIAFGEEDFGTAAESLHTNTQVVNMQVVCGLCQKKGPTATMHTELLISLKTEEPNLATPHVAWSASQATLHSF